MPGDVYTSTKLAAHARVMSTVQWPNVQWPYVQCPVAQCPTILLQVSECCILHSVYLCVSVTAYRLLNMHSVCIVGHLLHSYLQSELFMCVEPHSLSTNCILSASCASCAQHIRPLQQQLLASCFAVAVQCE